jgi:(p)ppGpp synthase/HD superfamily hydrolase
LLHDVVEDTSRTIEEIKTTFWDEVAFLCEW